MKHSKEFLAYKNISEKLRKLLQSDYSILKKPEAYKTPKIIKGLKNGRLFN
jgi:hypothetical protein